VNWMHLAQDSYQWQDVVNEPSGSINEVEFIDYLNDY
jgi:hypothetical protein